LNSLREVGKSSLDFKFDNEFMKKFKLKSNSITFKTHKQLDEFVQNLLDIDKDFPINYKGHWEFLKSFDRGK
jgi:hypothetical protein